MWLWDHAPAAAKVVILKDNTGKLRGMDEVADRAYRKFKKMVAELEIGQTIGFSWRMPRSPKHHALFFAKLQSLLSRTETFTDMAKLRTWLVMGAGFVDFVPGMDGKPNAIPQSMDFESMDEAEFSELHRQVDNFLWTHRAQETLWPALDDFARYQCMESLMKEFA